MLFAMIRIGRENSFEIRSRDGCLAIVTRIWPETRLPPPRSPPLPGIVAVIARIRRDYDRVKLLSVSAIN